MFDANASHLPDGKLFFAECHGIDPKNPVLVKLLTEGKNYLCEKVGDNPHDCKFRIFLNSSKRDWITLAEDFHNEDAFDDFSFFVYSGCPDGTGFINDEWKQKALDFLGGEWL